MREANTKGATTVGRALLIDCGVLHGGQTGTNPSRFSVLPSVRFGVSDYAIDFFLYDHLPPPIPPFF